MRRRHFLAAAPLLAARLSGGVAEDTRVYAWGDGIPHSPAEYEALLARIGVTSDVDAKLEAEMASRLGKEAAVWLPTMTLANELAGRLGKHLDCSRLLIETVYTGTPLKLHTRDFEIVTLPMDTVFNATAGAVIAGPAKRIATARQTRPTPMAAVALHFALGFEERFRKAIATSEAVIAALRTDSNFEIERTTDAANVFRMRVPNVNAPVYAVRAAEAGIELQVPPSLDWFRMHVNETWNRAPAPEIVARLRRSLG